MTAIFRKRSISLLLACLIFVSLAPKAQAAELDYTEAIRTFDFNDNNAAAITSDGGLYVWGDGYSGQIGNDSTTDCPTPLCVLENAFSVSVGMNHTAAVTSGGNLYTWGNGMNGQLGLGALQTRTVPARVYWISNVVSVTAGFSLTAAITENRSLYMWGINSNGEVGIGVTSLAVSTPQKVLENVKMVDIGWASTGSNHTVALTYTGDLYAWGDNSRGQVGNGTTVDQKFPYLVLRDVAYAYAGNEYTAAITDSGDLYLWGYNKYGQLGNGDSVNQLKPVKILSDIQSVALGNRHSAAITTDGDLYTWGFNSFGQVGNNTNTTQYTPVKVLEDATQVCLGQYNTAAIAITDDGTPILYTWGKGGNGQLGSGSDDDRATPGLVTFANNETSYPVAISMGGPNGNNGVALLNTGEFFTWGENADGQIGNGNAGTTFDVNVPYMALDTVRQPDSLCYTISFDLNGGTLAGSSATIPDQILTYGDSIQAPETPIRDGYRFLGWYGTTDASGVSWLGKKAYPSLNDFYKNTLSANRKTTLYAAWDKTNEIEYGTDNFAFPNEPDYFFKDYSKNKEYKNSLVGDYYDILIKNELYDPYIIAVNEARDSSWGGSCFGMACVVLMAKAGLLDLDFFQPDARTVHDLDAPKDNETIYNLLTYYQLKQRASAMGNKMMFDDNLSDLISCLENSEYPVLINFTYTIKKGLFSKTTYFHTVIGYDCTLIDEQYEIKIWDPADGFTPNTLYVKDDFSDSWFAKEYDKKTLFNGDTESTFQTAFSIESGFFDDKNLQTELENLNYSAAPVVLASSTEQVELNSSRENELDEYLFLNTNYQSFVLTAPDGKTATVVNGVKTQGELVISDGYYRNERGMEVDVLFALPLIAADQAYTVVPSSENISAVTGESLTQFKTKLIYYGDDGLYTSIASDTGGKLTLYGNGALESVFTEAVPQVVHVAHNNTIHSISGTTAGLSVAPDTAGTSVICSGADDLLTLTVSGSYNETSFYDVSANTGVRLEEELNTVYLKSADGVETLNAQEKGYALIFYTLSGTPITAQENIASGNTALQPEDPERPGYLFQGWYSTPNCENGTEWSFDTPIFSDTRIYAKWVTDSDYYHTVTFCAEGSADQIIWVADGQNIEDLPPVPEKEGFFGMWEPTDLTELTENKVVKAYYQKTGEAYPISVAYTAQSSASSNTIFLTVGNLTAPERPIRFIVAAYDINGKMLSCSSFDSDEDFTPTIQASIDLCYDEEPVSLKAFILDYETNNILRSVWETDITEYVNIGS